MEFSRQGSLSGLPFPSPGDLPDPGVKAWSLALQADSLLSEQPEKPLYPKPPGKKSVLLLLSHFSHVRLCVTLWTAACQAPLSMEFSRLEY